MSEEKKYTLDELKDKTLKDFKNVLYKICAYNDIDLSNNTLDIKIYDESTDKHYDIDTIALRTNMRWSVYMYDNLKYSVVTNIKELNNLYIRFIIKNTYTV